LTASSRRISRSLIGDRPRDERPKQITASDEEEKRSKPNRQTGRTGELGKWPRELGWDPTTAARVRRNHEIKLA
jgi:hypothetical protein